MAETVLSNADLIKALATLLKDGADFEKLPVSLKGNVQIQKMKGGKNTTPKLALLFNPNNKKRDTYFFNTKDYSTCLSDMSESAEGVIRLLKVIEKLNGTITKTTVKTDGLKVI